MYIVGFKPEEQGAETVRVLEAVIQFWEDPRMDISLKLNLATKNLRGDNGDQVRAFTTLQLPKIQIPHWLEF